MTAIPFFPEQAVEQRMINSIALRILPTQLENHNSKYEDYKRKFQFFQGMKSINSTDPLITALQYVPKWRKT